MTLLSVGDFMPENFAKLDDTKTSVKDFHYFIRAIKALL